jgi:hypothetical protein
MKWPFVRRKKYDELIALLDKTAARLDELKEDVFSSKECLLTKVKRDQMAERFAVEWLRSSLIKKEDVHFVKIAKYSRMLADAMIEELKQQPRPLESQKFNPQNNKEDE